MIIPKWIEPGDTIGVTAPSAGLKKPVDFLRFANGKKKLEEKGYQVRITEDVYLCDEKGRSTDGKRRGKEFNSLLGDTSVSAVIFAKGGDFLVEMLPFFDAGLLKRSPKWLQGYSDNTSLLYYVTTKMDIATIYGCHFGEFGMEAWHPAVENCLGVLEGKTESQHSFPAFEDGFHNRVTGLEGYFADKPVFWKNGRGEAEISVSGRLIGGCLDVLGFISGTKYDGTMEFCERYQDDGILWYLETYHASSEDLMMKLWQLKELGWFRYASGIVFGRPCMFETYTDTSYEEAVMTILEDLHIPIIFDADIGHKAPQFSIINGAVASVFSKGGKGELKYRF